MAFKEGGGLIFECFDIFTQKYAHPTYVVYISTPTINKLDAETKGST